MPTPQQILIGLLLPLIVTAFVAPLGSLRSRRAPWGAILALTLSFLLAYRGIQGSWPPVKNTIAPYGIGIIIVPIALLAIILSQKRIPAVFRALLAIAAPAAAVWYVFKPLPTQSMPSSDLWRWIILTTLPSVVAIASLSHLGRRGSTAASLPLGFLAAGTGLVILLTGNQNLGLLALSIATMTLGLYIAALITTPAILQRGPVTICITMLAALLSYGFFNPGVITIPELVLLCVSPLLALIPEAPFLRKTAPWKRELLRAALCLIPISIAVALAVVQFQKDAANSMEY